MEKFLKRERRFFFEKRQKKALPKKERSNFLVKESKYIRKNKGEVLKENERKSSPKFCRIFAAAMKNFRQILIGHEIFLKIFDGPQKILLCPSFLFFEYITSQGSFFKYKAFLKTSNSLD